MLVPQHFPGTTQVRWSGISARRDVEHRGQCSLLSQGRPAGTLIPLHGGRVMSSRQYYELRSLGRTSFPDRWNYLTGFRLYGHNQELLQDLVFDQHPNHFYSRRSGTVSGCCPFSLANEVTEGSGHKYNSSFVILDVTQYGITPENFPLLEAQIRYLPALEFMTPDVPRSPDLWFANRSIPWTIRRMSYNMSNQECALKTYVSVNELECRFGLFTANHRCDNWAAHICRVDREYALTILLEDMEIAQELSEIRAELLEQQLPFASPLGQPRRYINQLIQMGILKIHKEPHWGNTIDWSSGSEISSSSDSTVHASADESTTVEYQATGANEFADALSR